MRKKTTQQTRHRKARTSLPERTPTVDFNLKPGLLAAIQRLRGAEIQSAQDYNLALTTSDSDLIARKKKDWCDLLESLRKIESSNPEIERANAESLPLADVERETSRMCNAFRVALESLPRSLPQKLVGADEVLIQEILAKAINDALDQLHTNAWSVKP